jgi:hypothetical protein
VSDIAAAAERLDAAKHELRAAQHGLDDAVADAGWRLLSSHTNVHGEREHAVYMRGDEVARLEEILRKAVA